jgi:hypothetical protein
MSNKSSSNYIARIQAQNIVAAVVSGGRGGNSGSFVPSLSTTLGSIQSVFELPAGPPTAPNNLVASSFDDISIELSWNNTSSITGSVIEYESVSSGIIVPVTVSGSSTSYILTDLLENTSYSIRVTSVNNSGSSAPSASINVTTLLARPKVLNLGNITESSVELSWNSTFTDVLSSIVEYKKDVESSWTTINGVAESPRVVDGLVSETLYNFRVYYLTNSGAVTAPSTIVSGSTLAPE